MQKQELTLQRRSSTLQVWATAFGCIIGWGAFVMPGNTFLPKAGPLGTAIAFGIAALIMIIIALNYGFMINHYPVAGGEFTYAQMAFGDKHAFICAWFLSLSYLSIVPLNSTALALISRNLMNNVFQIGFHYTIADYDVYAGELFLAIGVLILFAVLCIHNVSVANWLQTVLAGILLSSILIIVIAAILSPKSTISNLQPVFQPDKTAFSGILSVLVIAPWAFMGFDTVPQSAEEFNFPPKKARKIMVFSIVFGGLLYITLNTVAASVVPAGYGNWAEYIADLSNLKGLSSLPTFYTGYELLGNFGVLFLGIAVLSAILSAIMGFYIAASRLLYSLARSRMLPSWFAELHPDYRTPVNAILFILGLSVIAPFFGRNVLNWIVDMSSVGAAIGYAYTSASALKFARKEKVPFTIFTGILGVIISFVFIILLLVPIPVFGCSLGKAPYICLIVWSILGLIFYLKKSEVNK